MIIRNSLQLLEQMSEVEKKIQTLEKLIEDLGIEIERESLIEAILARRN